MPDFTPQQVKAGQDLYTKSFLSIYDWFALGLNCRYVWKCPSYHMLELYNQYVSSNHLDIGVGTGYFLDRCTFPSASPRIALMDLNPNSLEAAGKRLQRYHPETHHHNVLEPFRITDQCFDSVGIMNLLHCLPGTMKSKGVTFENIKAVLNKGGIVFGSTILYQGIKRSSMATYILNRNNRMGIMTNKEDYVEDLERNLARYFSESSVHVVGCMALFRAIS
ncbi:MAG: methyltransferase [Chloroflexota bacterium]|nr:methyltransferase [Chloroflexota bacterium]